MMRDTAHFLQIISSAQLTMTVFDSKSSMTHFPVPLKHPVTGEALPQDSFNFKGPLVSLILFRLYRQKRLSTIYPSHQSRQAGCRLPTHSSLFTYLS